MIRILIAIGAFLISSISYGQPLPSEVSLAFRYNFHPIKDKDAFSEEKVKAAYIFETYKETDSKSAAFRDICDESAESVKGVYKKYTKDSYTFNADYELASSDPNTLLSLARSPETRSGRYSVTCTFRGRSENDPSKKIQAVLKEDVEINSLGAEVRTNIAVKFHGR
jgi:hypothetical protein